MNSIITLLRKQKMMTTGMLSSSTSIPKERIQAIEAGEEMTEEERKRLSHFFDTSEAYLSEKVELPSYKKHQNLIGFILSIVIIIYSSISYLLFVTYQVPLPFYLVDAVLSILSVFLFFFYRKSAVRYFYTVDLIVLLTNIVLSLLSYLRFRALTYVYRNTE